MSKPLNHKELQAAKAKAIRNRDKWALKSKALLEQGKSDEAALMLARADYWELERQKLEKMERERSKQPRTVRRKPGSA